MNVSSIEAKKANINVIDDIETIILNRKNQEITNINNPQLKNNNRKINSTDRIKNNSIQLNENDIREYAMNMPVKSNYKFFYFY